jgi:D-alanyl-D-alanine carboxypeptidase
LQFASAEKRYSAENTNVVIDKIPNLIASKTGYTDLAGGNLVIAFDAGLNHPIIISVLGSTEKGRFSDVLQLVQATLKQLPEL